MTKQTYQQLEESSYLAGLNSPYIEELYDQYLENPASLSLEWQDFFNNLTTLDNGQKEQPVSHHAVIERFKNMPADMTIVASLPASDKQEAVDDLIRNYRNLGHLQADLDPLKLHQHAADPRLNYKTYGLTEADFNKDYLTRGVLSTATASLKAILEALKDIYTKTVGFQFEYITDPEQRAWLETQIEQQFWQAPLSEKVKNKSA